MTEQRIRIDNLTINFHSTTGYPIDALPMAQCVGSTTGEDFGERFQLSNDNLIVIDRKLNVMWPVDESESEMTFEDGEIYASAYRLGGFSDWHLPDEDQLSSLRGLSRHNPCIDTNIFRSHGGWVWTRTPCAWSPDRVWIVGFDDGLVYGGRRGSRAFVRPVRSFSAGQ